MSWLFTIVFAGLMFSSSSETKFSGAEFNRDTFLPSAAVLQDESERFEQSYPFDPNGRLRVSNVNGSITVEGWDRNEIRLSYVKTADTKERLSELEVRIDAKSDMFTLSCEYAATNRGGGSVWRNGGKLLVDYRLMVPRGAILNEVETVNGSVTVSNFVNFTKVAAVNGSVKASNIRGTARLSTVNGEVAADFDSLDSGSKISLDTVNGKVNLLIPSDSNATIKADSLNGSITNDFGLPVRKGKYVGRDMYGRVGTGEVEIRLNSVNGTLAIGRKNDGKAVSPSVNLLPQKDSQDDNWSSGHDGMSKVDLAAMNKEIAKAVKEGAKVSQKALKEARVEMDRLGPELSRITKEALETAAREIDQNEMAQKIADAQSKGSQALGGLSDAVFFPNSPRIEKKSGSFAVKGVPQVTVDAPGCSVSIKGWAKSEVQYRVTQISSSRGSDSMDISDEHTYTSFRLKVVNKGGLQQNTRGLGDGVRIEIFVPKNSNLKINATGEIRMDGVSGDIQLAGLNQPINVRDTTGKLRVVNEDGRVRVIGFAGDIDVQSSDGAISLDGDFRTLNTRARSGSVVLTLAADTSADLNIDGGEVKGEGILITRLSQNGPKSRYRLGSGGRIFEVITNGEIIVRSSDSVAELF